MTGITDLNERRIAEAIVEEALGRGFTVAVDNGGDRYEIHSIFKSKIIEAMGHTGHDTLSFFKNGRLVGTATMIWGNGSCTLSDYTENSDVRAIVARAERLQDAMDDAEAQEAQA